MQQETDSEESGQAGLAKQKLLSQGHIQYILAQQLATSQNNSNNNLSQVPTGCQLQLQLSLVVMEDLGPVVSPLRITRELFSYGQQWSYLGMHISQFSLLRQHAGFIHQPLQTVVLSAEYKRIILRYMKNISIYIRTIFFFLAKSAWI